LERFPIRLNWKVLFFFCFQQWLAAGYFPDPVWLSGNQIGTRLR